MGEAATRNPLEPSPASSNPNLERHDVMVDVLPGISTRRVAPCPAVLHISFETLGMVRWTYNRNTGASAATASRGHFGINCTYNMNNEGKNS
jgi:hypothetical protein